MRQVVPDVYVMEGMRVNVYLLVSSTGLMLVDSGTFGSPGRTVAQIEAAGYALSDLHTIVLTHCHGDHMGGAAELARRSGAQVVAHRAEVPYIERTRPVPTAYPLARLLNWVGDRTVMRRPACHVDRPVQDGDVLEALGGMRVIHTPGHSPGSLCLYQPERGILFCGDALFNAHPVTGKPGLGLHMRFFASDNEQARATARQLSTLPVQVLCCGHGEPILEGASEKMRALFSDRQHA